MLGLEAYLQYFNKSDSTVNKGIEILEKGEAFPKAPIAVEEEEATNKDGKKKKLRKHIATLKTHYNSVLRKSLSTPILAALETHPAFRAASTVLLYYSLKDEVETHTFVQKWSKRNVFYSR